MLPLELGFCHTWLYKTHRWKPEKKKERRVRQKGSPWHQQLLLPLPLLNFPPLKNWFSSPYFSQLLCSSTSLGAKFCAPLIYVRFPRIVMKYEYSEAVSEGTEFSLKWKEWQRSQS